MEQVQQLIDQGRVQDAVNLVSRSAASGDADALITLANWRLEGRLIPRDLPASRELFRRAAEAGSKRAASVHTAFLANGTGGLPDWGAAIKQLRGLARKDQAAKRQLWLIDKMKLTADGDPASVPDGDSLSDTQQVMLFRGFMTGPECNYLVEAAKPLLQPSVIVDSTGRQVPNPVRTSDTAGFPWAIENPAIHALNRRIAAISRTGVRHGEPLQVLRYQAGQEYRPHIDAVPGLDNQRRQTVLVYLNDDYAGGQTHFPKLDLMVRAEKGDALLFRNCGDDGEPIDEMIHAGLPVTEGVKLIASRWIRERPLTA